MGWSRGSELAENIWNLIDNHLINDGDKPMLAAAICREFEDLDCDTLHECSTLIYWALHDYAYLCEFIDTTWYDHSDNTAESWWEEFGYLVDDEENIFELVKDYIEKRKKV